MATPKDDGLHVVIIGGGLAGLATALSTKLANPSHSVTVLESVKELQEVGAGLQITPNGTRLLSAWGLIPQLTPLAAIPTTLSVHRYTGTTLLAHEPDLQSRVLSRYGHPFWDLHRVDLQQALVARCTALGVTIRLDSAVSRVDLSAPSPTVHLARGGTVSGSVVILCDGLWSSLRSQFLGRPTPALPTGDLAYRLVLPLASLPPDDAELRALVSQPTVRFWFGPGAHAVGYSVRGGEAYNLVLLCPDDMPGGVSKAAGDSEAMRAAFAGWDPLLHRLLAAVEGETVQKWKLMWLDALEQWAEEGGRLFMAGDCCHPMLPYLAQGANSSLEDGAVLGALLGKVAGEGDRAGLERVARVYQGVRKGRGERIQREGFLQRDVNHLEDGEAQTLRDEVFARNLGKEEVEGGFPSRWTCPDVQGFLWGYDAYADAERGWKEDLEREAKL
ncbi:hypothetical protein QBC39DRAFT_391197 [Podospora conica]|nr:hypothetical protein QBC39DRAFT_391197 [Schizothecium conicum]